MKAAAKEKGKMKNKITFRKYWESYDILVNGQVVDQIDYCSHYRRKWCWAGTTFQYLSDAKANVKEHYSKEVLDG